ncbi:unnamed protein product [Symbiodinium natans]|uniref:SANT and BTB domain-containing protein n=1 Tax=Symbiodinium natans TaxID=878477 RepID=A0A812JPC2_9DINO|nr:unnamed protein product [Symbiodinium natans]
MEGSRQVSSLEAKDIVSILISSDFLQMQKLVDECLKAMHDALADILPLPLDLGCIPDRLVASLAALFRPEELQELEDPRDRLKSRLWAHLLHALLAQGDCVLHCCTRCQRLFTTRERLSNACPKTAGCGVQPCFEQQLPFVLQHTIDTTWDVGVFLYQLWNQVGRSWNELYWKVWARLQYFQCKICKKHFCGLELGECRYHPQEPVLNDEGFLAYPCCNATAAAAPIWHPGCCVKEHEPDLAGTTDHITLDQLRRRMPYIAAGAKDALLVVEARDVSSQGDTKEAPDPGAVEERTPRAAGADGKDPPEGEVQAPKATDASPEWCHKARYCCDPPPEHLPTGASSGRAGSRPRRRPRSAASHRGEESPRRAMEYRLQRSPYDDSSSLDDFFVEQASDNFPDQRLPTFFEPKLPKGVANQRKLHHMMDVLREDDRRRMDELVARSCVYQSRVAFQRQQASIGPSAAERQVQKLAWLVTGWTSSGPQHPDVLGKSEPRPRRLTRPNALR